MCHRMHFLDLQRLYVFWTAGLTTEWHSTILLLYFNCHIHVIVQRSCAALMSWSLYHLFQLMPIIKLTLEERQNIQWWRYQWGILYSRSEGWNLDLHVASDSAYKYKSCVLMGCLHLTYHMWSAMRKGTIGDKFSFSNSKNMEKIEISLF